MDRIISTLICVTPVVDPGETKVPLTKLPHRSCLGGVLLERLNGICKYGNFTNRLRGVIV